MQRPLDGGPIYVETDLSSFIAEPWNSLSSLAILLPAVYWAFKLRGQIKVYSFLYFCVPLLFVGGLGSTLFHGFRTTRAFLFMDFIPTAILMLSVSIYFWYKVLPKIWMVPVVVVGGIALRVVFFNLFPEWASINSNYFFTGSMVFLPIVFLLFKTQFNNLMDFMLAFGALLLALFFRERDYAMAVYLPMGSHFLWHLFSGVGAYFLANYLFKLRVEEIQQTSSK